MHIPDNMINGPICPVTAAVSAACIAGALVLAVKAKEKPPALKFGAVAALIFAAQMMNFPVLNGTSGHLLGAVLACAVLGTPFGVLAMSLVLAVQSLVFSDGGLTVLGANIINMAVVGSIAGAVFNKAVPQEKTNKPKFMNYAFLGAASWLSVVLASLACSIELAVSGTVEFSKVLPAMLGIHALIGIGEAVITTAVFYLFSMEAVRNSKSLPVGISLLAAGVIGLMLSPFASGFPDGLEWVAAKYQFLHESAPAFVSIMPGYTIPAAGNEVLSMGLAGLAGVAITFVLGAILARMAYARTGLK